MFQISRKVSRSLEPAPGLIKSSSDKGSKLSISRQSSNSSSDFSKSSPLTRSFLKEKYCDDKKLEFVHVWEANVSSLDPQNNNNELWGPDFATEFSNISLHWKSCISAVKDERQTATAIKCFVGYKLGPWTNIKAEFETKIQKPDGSWTESRNKAALWVLQGVSRGVVDLLPQEMCDFKLGDLMFQENPVKIVITLKISESYFDPIRAIDEMLERKQEKNAAFYSNDYSLNEQCYFGPAFKYVISDRKIVESESDFKVVAGKSRRTFHCHKFVFRQKIPEFSHSLFSKPLDDNTLVLENVNPDVISEVLYFMYKDRISEKFSKFALEILDLAEMLKYKELRRVCEPQIVKLLTPKNVELVVKRAHSNDLLVLKSECEKLLVEMIRKETAFNYLTIGSRYGLEVLKNVAANVIASNYKDVRKLNKDTEKMSDLWFEVYELMAERLKAYAKM